MIQTETPTEEIKARIDIVPFIEGYVRLQKAGVNFKALCPFHNERTPSFMVSPSRQTWHCFGCSKGGDIFSFLMEIEGLEFPEALKMLAERAGIELRHEAPQVKSERTRLLALLEAATYFYEINLRRHAEVGEYLKGRGLAGATAKEFRVGFAEDKWDGLLDYLAGKGYRAEEAEKVGLVIKSIKHQTSNYKLQATRFYDRFRNRIMFPIADSAGRIVGFSGRIFKSNDDSRLAISDQQAKYINTPQTIFYDKSRLLYAFDKAKQEIRKQNACVLVEGQMDALMAHQAGSKNAVAVSGTALTPLHLHQIRRLCERVVFAFDPDSAGIAANRRGLELAYEAGFEGVKIASLAAGRDPADMIASSPTQWKEAVEQAKESIAFFLDAIPEEAYAQEALPAGQEAAAKDHAAKALFPFLQRIESHMMRAEWLQRIAQRLRLPEESIADEFARFLRAVSLRNPPVRLASLSRSGQAGSVPSSHQAAESLRQNRAGGEPRSRRQLLEERLFGLLFLYPHLAKALHLELNRISSYYSPYGVVFLSHLTQENDGSDFSHEARQEASRLMMAIEKERFFTEETAARQEIVALLNALAKEALKEQLTATRMALAEAERQNNKEDQERLLHQFFQFIEEYKRGYEKEKTI